MVFGTDNFLCKEVQQPGEGCQRAQLFFKKILVLPSKYFLLMFFTVHLHLKRGNLEPRLRWLCTPASPVSDFRPMNRGAFFFIIKIYCIKKNYETSAGIIFFVNKELLYYYIFLVSITISVFGSIFIIWSVWILIGQHTSGQYNKSSTKKLLDQFLKKIAKIF